MNPFRSRIVAAAALLAVLPFGASAQAAENRDPVSNVQNQSDLTTPEPPAPILLPGPVPAVAPDALVPAPA